MKKIRLLLPLVALAAILAPIGTGPARGVTPTNGVAIFFDGVDPDGYHIRADMHIGQIPGGLKWFARGGPQGAGCVGNDVFDGFQCGSEYFSDAHLRPVVDCRGGERLTWGNWAPRDDSHRYNDNSTTAMTDTSAIGSIAIHKRMPDGTTPLVACARMP